MAASQKRKDTNVVIDPINLACPKPPRKYSDCQRECGVIIDLTINERRDSVAWPISVQNFHVYTAQRMCGISTTENLVLNTRFFLRDVWTNLYLGSP
jgi:hypothetical protein